MTETTRKEKDSLGELGVPHHAYYGIQTVRAQENFPISGITTAPVLIDAFMIIKKAAALINQDLQQLSEAKAQAIVQACDEVLAGELRDQFVVDVFQMGAGTSFHMNCNEVLANRASELLGGKRGDYLVHPNDDVNMGQSTNDAFPTAMRLSVLFLLRDALLAALIGMEETLFKKGQDFDKVLKSGRTHLQDAAPIRLGQEFAAYAVVLRKARHCLEFAAKSLYEIGIGGSGVGTGLNTMPEYIEMMVTALSELSGLSLRKAEDLREAMQSMRPFTEVSAAIRNLAVELNRIANDLRLLASGPRTGLAEIQLPPVAPGSSFMPGKVNPSMLEMLNMVCYQVIGCDAVICGSAQAGQLELNVFMPVIAFNLHFMIQILSNAVQTTRMRCIEGITADAERCQKYAEESLGIVTALTPSLGYAAAAEIAKEAVARGKSLIEVIEEKGLFSKKELKELLDPAQLTKPNLSSKNRKNQKS